MNETNGWIKLYRKITESSIWETKPSSWIVIWLYILLKVSFEDNSSYKRGQALFRGVEYEKLPFDITKDIWYPCLNWLEKEGMIIRQKVWRGEIITVINFEKYQSEIKATDESQTNHTRIIEPQINSDVVEDNLEAKNEKKDTETNQTRIITQDNIDENKDEGTHKNLRNKEERNIYNNKTIIYNEEESKNALKELQPKSKKEKELSTSVPLTPAQINHAKAKSLIVAFCNLRDIPLDAGFFSKNIKSAIRLVKDYPEELILAGINWRLQNDPDGFWNERLFNLNIVYSHFAEWIAQAKLTAEKKTFNDWLDAHKEQDYREIRNNPDARLKAFFNAFNRALKEGVVPTPEEWKKYQEAIDLQREYLRRKE